MKLNSANGFSCCLAPTAVISFQQASLECDRLEPAPRSGFLLVVCLDLALHGKSHCSCWLNLLPTPLIVNSFIKWST